MSRQHNSVITQTIKESYCGNRVFSESVNSKSAELSQMFKYTILYPIPYTTIPPYHYTTIPYTTIPL